MTTEAECMDDATPWPVAPIDAPDKVVSWFGVWMAEAAWDEMMRDD